MAARGRRGLIDMPKLTLNHLRLWQKLTVLVLAMSLPATLVGLFYWYSAGGTLSQARGELAGIRYLSGIGSLETALVTREGRAFALASGDAAARAAVSAAQRQVTGALRRLAGINSGLGERYGVRRDFRAVQSQWAAIEGVTRPARQVTAANAALLIRLGRLSDAVATGSRATSDPDPQTRSLVQIVSRYAPAALSDEAALRRYAEDAASKGYLGGNDGMGIRIAHSRLLTDLEMIRTALGQVPPKIAGPLSDALRTAIRQAHAYYATVAAQVLNANNLKISVGALHEAGRGARAALNALLAASSSAAAAAAKARVSALSVQRDLNLALVLIAIVLIHALTWVMERSLTSPMKRVVAIFERIAAGRYDSEVEANRTDELGQVLKALAAMQVKLRAQIENERAVAAENSRIRQALDKASTGVLLADAQHRIIYVNEAAETGFTRHAAELRRSLTGFDAAKLRGSSLEALSNSPAEERRVLDSLHAVRAEERTFGALNFRITTSPVTGEGGERLGTVMEWTERTQEMRVEQELQLVLAAVNGDDLTRRIELENKSGFFAALGTGVNRLADNLAEIVARVKGAAREILLGAEEITTGNSNLSTRTEEQASSLEETASSMEQMTTTVKQNADNAAQANQLALAAREQAEKGGTVVGQAVAAMSDINQASKRIADIIGVIDEIAFQTNLLALNAAVEAARAGEQGRGFAVVASEVRNLAGRSATAAKEIKGLIQDSVRKVEDGSVLVTQSGQTLEKIMAAVKKVSDIVAEIAAASREQSSGIEQVNRAVMQMDELTQQNAALVEQATAASQSMVEQVRGLNEMLGRFDVGDPHGEARAGATSRAAVSGHVPGGLPPPVAAAAGRTKGGRNTAPPPAERRKANRPWAQRTAAGPTSAPPTRGAPKLAAVSSGGAESAVIEDSEWQEF